MSIFTNTRVDIGVEIGIENNIQIFENDEEDQILKYLQEATKKHDFFETLIERNLKTDQIEENDDEWCCKLLLIGIKHQIITKNLDFKVIAFITAHFGDRRESFIDRACFLATIFFKKDDFQAQKRKSFIKFEKLLTMQNIISERQTKTLNSGYIEVSNPNVNTLYYQYDTPDKIIFDKVNNPIFLQKALIILQTSELDAQIKAVHYHFRSILDRTSKRTYEIYSDKVYEQLLDLSNNKVYDFQFKSLAYFLFRDLRYYEKALYKFKTTRLDTLRMYLLYSFDMLEDISDVPQKITVHLKFAEIILESEIDCDEIVKNQIFNFVEKGMRLAEKLSQDS